MDGTNHQNNHFCIEKRRTNGGDLNQGQRDYSNIYRTVDLLIVSSGDRAQLFDEINDSA